MPYDHSKKHVIILHYNKKNKEILQNAIIIDWGKWRSGGGRGGRDSVAEPPPPPPIIVGHNRTVISHITLKTQNIPLTPPPPPPPPYKNICLHHRED